MLFLRFNTQDIFKNSKGHVLLVVDRNALCWISVWSIIAFFCFYSQIIRLKRYITSPILFTTPLHLSITHNLVYIHSISSLIWVSSSSTNILIVFLQIQYYSWKKKSLKKTQKGKNTSTIIFFYSFHHERTNWFQQSHGVHIEYPLSCSFSFI